MRLNGIFNILLYSFLLGSSIAFFSCKKGKNNPESCNGSSTRGEVKIGVDDLVGLVDTIPIQTTVDSIGSINVPDANSDSERQEIEQITFRITAKVHKVSKHRDGDWKIKLTDGNDKYINCEAPNMGCRYIKNALFYDEMKSSRDRIETHQDDLEGKMVTITGVAHIDIDHKYPRNAAENELELHPIIAIEF